MTHDYTNMDKSITVNFKAAPTDHTTTCTLKIDWSSISNIIYNLCVLIVVEETGESVFSFLSLQALQDNNITLPEINTDLRSKSLTIYVYGLNRPLSGPYFYKVCASGMTKLIQTVGTNNKWELDLQPHSIESLSMMSHRDIAGQEPFTMEQPDLEVLTTDFHLLADVLIVLKEDQEIEEFWLTTPLKNNLHIPSDMLTLSSSIVKVYSLQKVSIEKGLMIYKKSAASREEKVRGYQNSKPPSKPTDMNRDELETLMKKAENYIKKRTSCNDLISFLYRNKSVPYFKSIKVHDGVMETYIKDYNGHPASSINGAISGLFFGTHLFNGGLPTLSPYGSSRLKIPVQNIIKRDCNMYFADFYCLNPKSEGDNIHYVTIVVTKKGSQTDDFCEGKLIKLYPTNNMFICTSDDFKSFSVPGLETMWVEIFYTEDIDISSFLVNEQEFFSEVEIIGSGESQKYGLPRYENCSICK